MAKRSGGDPIKKSVELACSQIFEIEDRFIPLQAHLTKYAQNLKRNSIALLVKQRAFDSGKFNYYYTNGSYGMKNCFEGIELEPGLTELLNEFCEVLTYYISQCLLENMNTDVNIMVDPNRPIIIQRREHFDILMPIPTEE